MSSTGSALTGTGVLHRADVLRKVCDLVHGLNEGAVQNAPGLSNKDGPTLNVQDGALDKHLQLDGGHVSVLPTTKRTCSAAYVGKAYAGLKWICRHHSVHRR